MDPFTGISLAANLVSFTDFSLKTIAVVREITSSASGTSVRNEKLESLAKRAQEFTATLRPGRREAEMTPDERRLNEVVLKCQAISADLVGLLDDLRSTKPKSRRAALGAVFRSMRSRDKTAELDDELDKCMRQLHLELSQKSRQVTYPMAYVSIRLTPALDLKRWRASTR
jgi:hypothetical protein